MGLAPTGLAISGGKRLLISQLFAKSWAATFSRIFLKKSAETRYEPTAIPLSRIRTKRRD